MSTVNGPGLWDVEETAYHADTELVPELGRSLSASSAKTILKSPERFAYEREHPIDSTDAMDRGTLVHALVLHGGDNRIRVLDVTNWMSKASQAERKKLRAQRLIPCNRKELLAASKVAAAVRRHPLAGPMFSVGKPEVSMYWIDEPSGVTCRARVDWVHPKALIDLKTVGRYGDAEVGPFGRKAANLDYPLSAAHYSDGYEALTGQRLPFITVVVECEPPYFVTVGQYDEQDMQTGRDRMRRALDIYAERESSGRWVDPPEIQTIPIPRYCA